MQSISVCVRLVDGRVLEEDIAYSENKRRECLQGTSGVIIVDLVNSESIEAFKRRVSTLLEKTHKNPKIPLSVLSTRRDDKESCEKFLKELKDSGKISSFTLRIISGLQFSYNTDEHWAFKHDYSHENGKVP